MRPVGCAFSPASAAYSRGSQWSTVTSKVPSSLIGRRIDWTVRRMRTSTPLSAAFSASAMLYSYGISVPASGERSAAVASSDRLGSIARSSSPLTIRRLSTPLVAPRARSSSRCASSSAPRATTSEPVSWYPK